jgi:hypothetical protein
MAPEFWHSTEIDPHLDAANDLRPKLNIKRSNRINTLFQFQKDLYSLVKF